MKSLTELTEADFDPALSNADAPVVVDFYAPWCGPCKVIAPLLEQVAEHYADRIQFYKVNVDEAPELAGRFQITGVPTLLLFHHAQVCDSIVGFPAPQLLIGKLEALASLQTAAAVK